MLCMCLRLLLVALGYVFLAFDGGGAISAVRMLRLIRLLTFVKGEFVRQFYSQVLLPNTNARKKKFCGFRATNLHE